ncbi:hypothetical protein TCAL_03346 [Tigriopus californicus]|uniref:Uncharacterized protein n=1 Tax=Tigriopus californicus TaxID=6832 RepID=A0A553P7D2_TIGCA|nr:hypothetical protein TCAL_03346 [Tigriopus californicus]
MTACIVTLVTIAFFFLLQPSSGEQSQGGYPHSLHERSIREKHWNSLVGHIINKHHNALLTHHFKGEYKETGARIHVPPAKLPIWMLSGKYSAQAELWDTNGHLGCLKLNIKLA